MSTELRPMPRQQHEAIRKLLVTRVLEDAHQNSATVGARWSRPGLIGFAAASVITAAISATLVIADPSAPPTYASWTAVPDSSFDEAEARNDWRSRCTDLGVGGTGFVGVPTPKWSAREVLVDRRGDFVFCVDIAFGDGSEDNPFIGLAGIRADEGSESLNTMHGVVRDEAVTAPTGDQVLVVGMTEVEPDPDPSIRMLSVAEIYGVVGPDVTAVEIDLANGAQIIASVENGLFGAWWPTEKGAIEGAQLRIQGVNGTRTVAATGAFD